MFGNFFIVLLLLSHIAIYFRISVKCVFSKGIF